jgi:hypothetical protein
MFHYWGFLASINKTPMAGVGFVGVPSGSLTLNEAHELSEQFTDCYDKNSIPIWEGDIVEKNSAYSADPMRGIIEYYNGGFWLRLFKWYRNPRLPLYKLFNNLRVIGNIHQNSELLEKFIQLKECNDKNNK